MNIVKSLLHKRTVKKAFEAVDRGDLSALVALNVDANTTRFAVLEKHTFNWEESLLSRAIGGGQYAVAEHLLNKGANPYFEDQINRDLNYKLRQEVRRTIVDPVAHNQTPAAPAQSIISVSNYQATPLLSCMVAMAVSLQRSEHLQPQQFTWYDQGFNPDAGCVVSDQELNAWLEQQTPAYESALSKSAIEKSISQSSARATAKKM